MDVYPLSHAGGESGTDGGRRQWGTPEGGEAPEREAMVTEATEERTAAEAEVDTPYPAPMYLRIRGLYY